MLDIQYQASLARHFPFEFFAVPGFAGWKHLGAREDQHLAASCLTRRLGMSCAVRISVGVAAGAIRPNALHPARSSVDKRKQLSDTLIWQNYAASPEDL
jgi:hypothetical protein